MQIVCSVFDKAVEAFSPVMCVPARGAAVRSFMDECNNSQSALSRHPADYALYEVGEFHEQSGQLVPYDPPRLLCNGQDVRETV